MPQEINFSDNPLLTQTTRELTSDRALANAYQAGLLIFTGTTGYRWGATGEPFGPLLGVNPDAAPYPGEGNWDTGYGVDLWQSIGLIFMVPAIAVDAFRRVNNRFNNRVRDLPPRDSDIHSPREVAVVMDPPVSSGRTR
jgi:hypothetical protein